MSADPLNANPTILSASDLPTRRRRPSSHTNIGAFSAVFSKGINVSSPSSDPFATSPISLSDSDSEDDAIIDRIDEQEIYDLISSISDPEHPLSLGELAVVNLPDIDVRDAPTAPFSTVLVQITPTITHCSLATVIGLGVRVRLEQALPPRFRVDVRIKEGTHSTADQVNKQLNDKERVAAALENGTLMGVLNKMLETCR
ncbi:hypothetical protein FGG08_001643 [Glutinoglossum americanum]|uniref:MIP18 family-like domain-containing protein n=1 Tax=Glutinoglossum americanum TaxID=1670608 RepID=A0A9P8IGL0_9PEZI|nr:hypothetical protein FGG08_001643 [Glutinoglossum americanum]